MYKAILTTVNLNEKHQNKLIFADYFLTTLHYLVIEMVRFTECFQIDIMQKRTT